MVVCEGIEIFSVHCIFSKFSICIIFDLLIDYSPSCIIIITQLHKVLTFFRIFKKASYVAFSEIHVLMWNSLKTFASNSRNKLKPSSI